MPHFSTPLREVGIFTPNAIADFVAPRFQTDALPLGAGSKSFGHSFQPDTSCCPAGSEEPALGELPDPGPQRAHGVGCEAASDSPGPPDVAFGWRSAYSAAIRASKMSALSHRGISLQQTELRAPHAARQSDSYDIHSRTKFGHATTPNPCPSPRIR